MNATRQILRYSIPGSLLLLHGVACFLLYRRLQGVPFAASSEVLGENVRALIAILATIPIGFVIYQVYYFSYSPLLRAWPRGWQGRLIRPDRGSEILSVLQPSQITALSVLFGSPLDVSRPHQPVQKDPKGWYRDLLHKAMARLGLLELTPHWQEAFPDTEERGRAYSARWYANWDAVRAILDIASSTEGGRQIKEEYTTLSDIYHALGAARTALTLALLGVIVLVPFSAERFLEHPVGSLLGLLLISLLTLGFGVVLHLARVRTWQTAAASLQLGLRWFFWVHADDFTPPAEASNGAQDGWLNTALRAEMPAAS
ncbi:MAG TPA: hypothetical protein VFR04_05165 [Solirubrobacterales bacterium]|nr:hypothetical protein [Solirubrobacterales bacterium]